MSAPELSPVRRRVVLGLGGAMLGSAMLGGAARGQPASPAVPLKVLGIGAVEHAVRDLAEDFNRATGRAVTLETGNGGQVAARIRAGERFDVVLNAATTLDALIAEGRLDGTTRRELGRVRIGLAVRRGAPLPAIGSADALRAALLAAPSIAHSDGASGATTGRHILAMLEKLGIAQAVAARLMPFPRGLLAVQAVADGRAALVMTQTSEIVVVPGVVLVGPLPAALQLITPYVGAAVAGLPEGAAAREFLDHLAGSEGRARFRAAGFTVT